MKPNFVQTRFTRMQDLPLNGLSGHALNRRQPVGNEIDRIWQVFRQGPFTGT
jgi:hypothetical protein